MTFYPSGGGGTPGAGQWARIVDIDFTAQPNQTFGTNGNYTIAGLTWSKFGSSFDQVAPAIVNGTGLVLQPSLSSIFLNGSVANTFPGLQLPFSSLPLTPSTIEWDQRFRIWYYTTSDQTQGGCTELFGYDVQGCTGNFGQYFMRGLPSSQHQFTMHIANAGNSVASSVFPHNASASNRVVVFETELVAPVNPRRAYYGAIGGGGAWPDLATLTPLAIALDISGGRDLTTILGGVTLSTLGFFLGGSGGFGGPTPPVITIPRFAIDWRL